MAEERGNGGSKGEWRKRGRLQAKQGLAQGRKDASKKEKKKKEENKKDHVAFYCLY